MKEKDYTLDQICKLTGLHMTTLSQKLNGYRDFTQTEIDKLCEVLEITKQDIGYYFF